MYLTPKRQEKKTEEVKGGQGRGGGEVGVQRVETEGRVKGGGRGGTAR